MIKSALTSFKEIDLIIIIRQLENVLLAQKKEATVLLSSILVFLITLSYGPLSILILNALVLYKCVRKNRHLNFTRIFLLFTVLIVSIIVAL